MERVDVTFGSVSEASAAAWFAKRLHPFAQDVGSVIPPGFDAYARVLHPAYRESREHPVRWQEIAAANGRIAHAEMQFGNIAGTWTPPSPQPQVWSIPPRIGSLPADLARSLVSVLRPQTRTADRCWFALWEGYLHVPAPRGAPLLRLPHRKYYVTAGPIDDALRSIRAVDGTTYQSVSMWWPDDRSWFVSTEVDLAWTYVGGAREAIDDVLAQPEIEALRARLSDRFTWDGDSLNPSPGRP